MPHQNKEEKEDSEVSVYTSANVEEIRLFIITRLIKIPDLINKQFIMMTKSYTIWTLYIVAPT